MAERVKDYVLLVMYIMWDCLKLEVWFLFVNLCVLGFVSVLFDLFIKPLTESSLVQPLIAVWVMSVVMSIPVNIICIAKIIVDSVRDFSFSKQR